MAVEPLQPTPQPSPARLWAEQLAIGSALFLGILIFMAFERQDKLAAGASILKPQYIDVYGVATLVSVLVQIVMHEVGSIFALWRLKIPVRLRFFGFGATATASLEQVPRNVWTDARVGMSGPLTGAIVSAILAGVYWYTHVQDQSPAQPGEPFYLGMACIGAFYSLLSLIPILDLEGGWIAPAIMPQAWLIGLIASVFELTSFFNIVLLGVVCFGLPRLFLILRARAPRTDTACKPWQRILISVAYFLLVLVLGWFSSKMFTAMPGLIRSDMGD